MVCCFFVTGSVVRIVRVVEPRSVIVPGMKPCRGEGDHTEVGSVDIPKREVVVSFFCGGSCGFLCIFNNFKIILGENFSKIHDIFSGK